MLKKERKMSWVCPLIHIFWHGWKQMPIVAKKCHYFGWYLSKLHFITGYSKFWHKYLNFYCKKAASSSGDSKIQLPRSTQ